MSARRKMVPVTTGIHAPEFLITNWSGIEKACKFKSELPDAARTDIAEATRRFLWLENMEAKAIPSAGKKNELFEIAKDARRLRLKLEPLKQAASVPIAETIKIDYDSSFQTLHRLGRQFEGTDTLRSIK